MGDMQQEESINQQSTCSPDSSSFNADEPPLVFQCAQCNVIIGDSTAWACVDDISRTITLKNVSNAVVEDEEMKIANTGFDAGSTYYKMSCATCREDIGRRYKGAVNHLDSARGMYTLFVDKLSSYQIGSYNKDSNDTAASLSDILSMAKVRDLNMQLSRLGDIIQDMGERLQALEQGYLPQAGDDSFSVRSVSYPCSSTVSLPSRTFNRCSTPHAENYHSDSVFKIPHTCQRHPQPPEGAPGTHPSGLHGAYAHLEHLHKMDQKERPLGIDPDQSYQSHSHNLLTNRHSNISRQQRRNSLSIESLPQNFRPGQTMSGHEGQTSAQMRSTESRGKVGDQGSNSTGGLALRGGSKRKEVSPSDPLQVMMSRRRKRRI
uniref:Uncharacterized protein LOC111103880 isoform X1 n=2 Tax=Crassostrea virginica TaxID=6565 RepID=A0A8B8AQ38_CRAVI|nr:uncharacterized protein LOC111103880 isoform X1 [Crassostrea virginica]